MDLFLDFLLYCIDLYIFLFTKILVSICSLPVYRNVVDFYMLTFYPAVLIYQF